MVAYEFEFERGKCENARVGNEVAVNKFFPLPFVFSRTDELIFSKIELS